MWVLGLCVGALAHIFLGCTDNNSSANSLDSLSFLWRCTQAAGLIFHVVTPMKRCGPKPSPSGCIIWGLFTRENVRKYRTLALAVITSVQRVFCSNRFRGLSSAQSLTWLPLSPVASPIPRLKSEARTLHARRPVRVAGSLLFWMRRRMVRVEHPNILATVWTRSVRSGVFLPEFISPPKD